MSTTSKNGTAGPRLAIDYAPLVIFFLVNFLAPQALTMVPRDIATIAEIPTTVGGKIDRAALPEMQASTEGDTGAIVAPENDLERLLADGIADILKRPGGVSVDADFFEDLGGDSLSAAMLVTLLRDHHHTEWITVSDIYDARTVRRLAKLADRTTTLIDAADEPALVREGEARPLLANIVQIAWLSGQLLVGAWATWSTIDTGSVLAPGRCGDWKGSNSICAIGPSCSQR